MPQTGAISGDILCSRQTAKKTSIVEDSTRITDKKRKKERKTQHRNQILSGQVRRGKKVIFSIIFILGNREKQARRICKAGSTIIITIFITMIIVIVVIITSNVVPYLIN